MTKKIAAADPSDNGAILDVTHTFGAIRGFRLRHSFIRGMQRACFGPILQLKSVINKVLN